MSNFMRRLPSSPLAAGAMVLFLTLGCGQNSPEETDVPASAPTQLVAVTEARVEEWRETVELSIETAPWAAVTVAAEVAGRVVELEVEHGDKVRAGQILARLDSATAEAELEQAMARHLSAAASLEQARRDLERGRLLSGEHGILSSEDLDRLQLAVATGEARAQESTAEVLVLKERVDDMAVRAPFAGTVSARHAELGSWLATGQPIVRLLNNTRLKARGAASQTDRVRLSLDALAEIRADALGQMVFAGRLRYLGEEADPATGTYLVEAEVDAESGGKRLLPGMRGSMTLELMKHRDLLLPRTALVDGAVFVLDGDKAIRRAVSSEPIGPGRMRILDGLEAGERVVVQGQHRLADGVLVKVRQEEVRQGEEP